MTRQPIPKLSKPGVGAVLQKSFRLLRGHAQHFFIVAAALIFPLTLISSLIHTPTFNSIVNDTPGLIFTLIPANSSLSVIRNPADLHQSLLDFPTHFHSKHLLQVETGEQGSVLGITVAEKETQKSGFLGFLRGMLHGFVDESKNLTIPDSFNASVSSLDDNSLKKPELEEKVSLVNRPPDIQLNSQGEAGNDDGMLASFTEERATQLLRMVLLVLLDLGAWLLLKCVSEAAVAISVAGSYLGTLAGLPGQPRKVFFTKDYFRSLRQASGRVFVTILALGSLFTIINVVFLTTLLVEYSVLMVLMNVPAVTIICIGLTTLFFTVVVVHVLIVTNLASTVSVLEGRAGWTALSRSAHLIRNSRRFSTTFLLKLILLVLQYLLLGLGLNALLFGFIDFSARLLLGHKSLEEFARTEGVVKIPWMVIDYEILFNNTVATAVILLTIVVNTVLFFFCKTGCGEHLGEHVTFGGNIELTDVVRDASIPLRTYATNNPHDSLLEFVSPPAPHGFRHGS